MVEALLCQGRPAWLLRDSKYNWAALLPLAMAQITHFSPAHASSPVARRRRPREGDEMAQAFQALRGDDPKQDLSLVLTVAFI